MPPGAPYQADLPVLVLGDPGAASQRLSAFRTGETAQGGVVEGVAGGVEARKKLTLLARRQSGPGPSSSYSRMPRRISVAAQMAAA